ncbi:MAG: zinc ribbon domain-containing protein [Planctomycetes bacterium]|nr:zinc ribbon domain-containing protein [Planctomycetota bacterium]NOG53204.1 zinc ribbon domain-containing protein [Planctomycetota bacterium]
MSLSIRKLVVIVLTVGIVILANLWAVTHWLDQAGVIEIARTAREHFLTGTSVAVITALLILLVNPRRARSGGSCPVCSSSLPRGAKYCPECGGRV